MRRHDAGVAGTPSIARRALACASLVALGLAALGARPRAAHADEATPLDGIAAIVGGLTPTRDTDVILRSDVELRARLDALGTAGAPDAPLPDEVLAATLDVLVSEAVVVREALRLHAAAPPPDDVRAQRQAWTEAAGGEAALAGWLATVGADAAELDAIAARRALAESFLRANLRGGAVAFDAEVERVYASGAHPFADRPLDEVREALRAWLAARTFREDVARWVTLLRGRTQVRIVVPFAPPRDRGGHGEVEDVGTVG